MCGLELATGLTGIVNKPSRCQKGGMIMRLSCAWRIVISPMIPQDFASCSYSSMRNLAVLVIHLIATLARLLGPGGVRSLVAGSLLLKHQLLIVNRSRQRSPNLSSGGPHPCRLAGGLGASNPPSPFRNCTEALHTARASIASISGKRICGYSM